MLHEFVVSAGAGVNLLGQKLLPQCMERNAGHVDGHHDKGEVLRGRKRSTNILGPPVTVAAESTFTGAQRLKAAAYFKWTKLNRT